MINPDSSEYPKPKVSNLTKNLQNHIGGQIDGFSQQSQSFNQMASSAPAPTQPPPYNSITSSNRFPTSSSVHAVHQGHHGTPGQQGHQGQPVHHTPTSNPHIINAHDPSSVSSHQSNPPSSFNQFNSYSDSFSRRESLNYIPSSHNTPNMVSSSYSSNQSYNKYNFKPSHSIPTTNVTIDNNLIPNFQRNSLGYNSVPTNFDPSSGGGANASSNFPIMNTNTTTDNNNNNSNSNNNNNNNPNSNTFNSNFPNPNSNANQNNRPPNFHHHSFTTSDNSLTNITPTPPQAFNYITEPDHYMTYGEFFQNLSSQDGNEEEHTNIVEYPVNDLIMMLSCLLTKIIEANDKLHPNHFDNTVAIRQKLKEDKRIRKLERAQHQEEHKTTVTSQGVNINESLIDGESSDDEEDEMKNKYLANVLAFHGTNVPGISLHAYLSRVLKYCPVTNEVFLSLLVYFDRIAKKANNLKKDTDKDGEQLFVMDSYNIHRLIISGITVSSKFFSDIFYKNLRYAKVGGLPLEELNYLELQFLLLLDFKLMISVEDLQNYGDLLLRFWKREQITNELVNQPQNEPSQVESHT